MSAKHDGVHVTEWLKLLSYTGLMPSFLWYKIGDLFKRHDISSLAIISFCLMTCVCMLDCAVTARRTFKTQFRFWSPGLKRLRSFNPCLNISSDTNRENEKMTEWQKVTAIQFEIIKHRFFFRISWCFPYFRYCYGRIALYKGAVI